MKWAHIKSALDTVAHKPRLIKSLVNDPEFWKTNGDVLVRAISYLHKRGYDKESLYVINEIAKRDCSLNRRTQLHLQHLEGDILHAVGDYAKALRAYDQILSLQPDEVAFANRGLANWELGKHADALSDYLSALSLNPRNAVALRGAGEMLLKLDKVERAIRYFRKAIEIEPRYSLAYRALGVAYYRSARWVESYRALKRAAKLNPKDLITRKGIRKIETTFGLE